MRKKTKKTLMRTKAKKAVPKPKKLPEEFVQARPLAVAQKKNGNGGFGLKRRNGNGVTALQEAYAEQLVYGGKLRTARQWSTYVGVSYQRLLAWHKDRVFNEHMALLQEERKQAIQLALSGKVAGVVEQLETIIQIDPTYLAKTKTVQGDKTISKRTDPRIVEQSRLAIQDFFSLLGVKQAENGRQSQFQFNQVLQNYQHQTASGTKSAKDIQSELEELRALEPGEGLIDGEAEEIPD